MTLSSDNLFHSRKCHSRHPGSLSVGRGHSYLSQNKLSCIPIGTKLNGCREPGEGGKWVAMRGSRSLFHRTLPSDQHRQGLDGGGEAILESDTFFVFNLPEPRKYLLWSLKHMNPMGVVTRWVCNPREAAASSRSAWPT